MDQSDEKLIQAMATLDQNALVELHKRYAPYLTTMARKMLSDVDEVQQCVQDAFMKAWDAAKTFDSNKASAKTWLVTIAHRTVLNKIRGSTLETVPIEVWDNPQTSPNYVTHVVMENAVGLLETDAKELIDLAFYKGYSHGEIANLLDMPLDTVKGKLRSTLNILRDELESKGGDV